MNTKLKNVIQWTIYGLLIFIVLFSIGSLIINVVAPTFFPDADISGFKDYIDQFCIILSFLSVGLGVYSIWQASESGKQATEMINSLHALKQQQDMLVVTLKSTNDLRVVSANSSNGQWVKDDVVN